MKEKATGPDMVVDTIYVFGRPLAVEMPKKRDLFRDVGIAMGQSLMEKSDSENMLPLIAFIHDKYPAPTCGDCQQLGRVAKFGTRGSKKPRQWHLEHA